MGRGMLFYLLSVARSEAYAGAGIVNCQYPGGGQRERLDWRCSGAAVFPSWDDSE
jgi:hypothetical protein